MSERLENHLVGAVIGLLIGLAYCYWKQITAAYQNRGLISSASNAYSAVSDFAGQLGQKL